MKRTTHAKPRRQPPKPVKAPMERSYRVGDAVVLNYGMPGVIERYGGEDEYWLRLHNKDLGRFRSSQFRRAS